MAADNYIRDCLGCSRFQLLRMRCALDGQIVVDAEAPCRHKPSRWEPPGRAHAQDACGVREQADPGWDAFVDQARASYLAEQRRQRSQIAERRSTMATWTRSHPEPSRTSPSPEP